MAKFVEPASGDDLNLAAHVRGKRPLYAEEVHRVDPEADLGYQVEVTIGSILPSRDRAEHGHMEKAAGLKLGRPSAEDRQGTVEQFTAERAACSFLSGVSMSIAYRR